MSRHTIAVHRGDQIDRTATIGYDRMLRTYFLQAFPDADGNSQLWLGCFLQEYPTLEELETYTQECGYQLAGITGEMRASMLKEASQPHQRSIGEILGLVL